MYCVNLSYDIVYLRIYVLNRVPYQKLQWNQKWMDSQQTPLELPIHFLEVSFLKELGAFSGFNPCVRHCRSRFLIEMTTTVVFVYDLCLVCFFNTVPAMISWISESDFRPLQSVTALQPHLLSKGGAYKSCLDLVIWRG